MKLLIFILIKALTLSPAHSSTCSKKVAEDKVRSICDQISTQGAGVKSKWPQSLLHKNCGDNYVWIQEAFSDKRTEVKMVMHPVLPRLNGRIITRSMDEYRFPLTAEFDKAAKKNIDGAWVDYDWPKIGGERARPKTSFVKLCKLPTGDQWLAGSGLWKEDLN